MQHSPIRVYLYLLFFFNSWLIVGFLYSTMAPSSPRQIRNDINIVLRPSSFPANFETILKLADYENSLPSESIPFNQLVHVSTEESQTQDEEHASIFRKAQHILDEQNQEIHAASQKKPALRRRCRSLPDSPCSCNEDNGTGSPFSAIIHTMSWFTGVDYEEASKLHVLPNGQTSKDDDDEQSVASAAYFDPVDFDASYWRRASMHVPTFGLALLALTTAVAHPLFFFLGAVTAYGTATAALKSYGYFQSEDKQVSFGGCLYPDASVSSTCDLNPDTLNTLDGKKKVVQNHETYIENKENETSEEEQTIASSTEIGLEIQVGSSEPNDTFLEPFQQIDFLKINSQSNIRGDSTQLTWTEHDEVTIDWVHKHYPPLMNAVHEHVFVGLNTIEFFRVFFDDDAPYNFKVFQEKRGDVDIKYGCWKHLPESGSLSLLPAASSISFPVGLEYHSFQGRSISFKARTNSFVGPPWATTKKTQRILIVSKRLAVLESRTDLSDIPFCDRFFVMERWVLTAEKELDHYTTRVTTSCEVVFTGSCTFESQIRSKSTTTISDIVASWCIMASEALKLTEQHKAERLKKSTIDSDVGACDQKKSEQNQDSPLRPSLGDAIEVKCCDNAQYRAVIVGEERCTSIFSDDIVLLQKESPPEVPLNRDRTKKWARLRRSIILPRTYGSKNHTCLETASF